MITKVKPVYYCEFCGRHRLTSYSIRKHEKHCTLNPHRVCGMCDCSDLTPVLDKYQNRFRVDDVIDEVHGCRTLDWVWLNGPVTLDEIEVDTEYCPACTLAVLRQTGLGQGPSPIEFDFASKRDEWWAERNAEREEERCCYY